MNCENRKECLMWSVWRQSEVPTSVSLLLSQCGNKISTRCNRWFLLQILLLAQYVSGTIMPIIRSSRVLYKWLLPIVFGALVFKLSVWCGAEGCVSGLRAAVVTMFIYLNLKISTANTMTTDRHMTIGSHCRPICWCLIKRASINNSLPQVCIRQLFSYKWRI